MATLTEPTGVRVDLSSLNVASQLTLIAGEALFCGAACRVHTDGKIYLADGSAADAESRFAGFALEAYAAGQHATIASAPVILGNYCVTAQAIGLRLFLSATDGRLDDAATVGGLVAIAEVIPNASGSGKDIRCIVTAAGQV